VQILEMVGMKYTKYIFGLLILAGTVAMRPAAAQNHPAAYVASSASNLPTPKSSDDPQDSVLTIRKRVDEVNVLFIATDKHGKFVRNLTQNDFNFLDDHKPVQSIVNFRRETDLPLKMGLLIDVSGSVHTRFDFEQDAATSFMQHVIRTGFDKAFVMGFNSSQELTQDFTDNVAQLSQGVHALRDGGGTALYDAIYRACHDKLLKEQADRPQRKALILLSDGDDNQSDYTLAQAVEMAQRAEVIIYAISTDDSGLILRGDKNLDKLAAATGGRAFFPFKMKDIKNSFAAIEDELRSQYVVSYHPADFDSDGRYRSIEISALKKDLQVRARKGYYAPRQ
jgi:Ca-activated chloride channel family protein